MKRYITSSILLGLVALFFQACSRPLADQIALSGEQTQRAIVGYDESTYEYPIQVPNSNRFVTLVSEEPLNYKPTYEDFLQWKEGNTVSANRPESDSEQ